MANPPVPPLVLVFFLFMMQNYSAIEDAKPQRVGKNTNKKESKNQRDVWFSWLLNFSKNLRLKLLFSAMQKKKTKLT